MFERFTDRARAVMALANAEAQRLNHGFVSPGHILLGLIAGGGVAADVLARSGADVGDLRAEVESIAGVPVGAPGTNPMEGSQRVIEAAIREARALGHNYVGTEHLLLGVFCVGGPVGEALGRAGLTPERGRAAVLEFMGQGPPAALHLIGADDAMGHICARLRSISDELTVLAAELSRLVDERRGER